MVPAIVAAAATAIALYGGLRSASDMANTLYEAAVHDSAEVFHVAELDGWIRPGRILIESPPLARALDLDQLLIRPAELPAPPRLAPPALDTRFSLEGGFMLDRPAAVEVRSPVSAEVEFDESLAPADLEQPRAPALPPIESGRDN
jgi:hypothetical protein